MPKGVTPKERMKRSIMTLAKNLKPSGRLNVDDITKAGELRKGMTRKDYKMTNIKKKMDEDYVKKYDNKMGYMKDVGSLGRGAGSLAEIIAAGPGGMGLTGTAKKVYDFAKKMKPSGRLNEDDLKTARKMLMQTPDEKISRTKSRVAAPQTRTYGNKPTESVFQKLKRAQMLRKMSGK